MPLIITTHDDRRYDSIEQAAKWLAFTLKAAADRWDRSGIEITLRETIAAGGGEIVYSGSERRFRGRVKTYAKVHADSETWTFDYRSATWNRTRDA